MLKDKLYQLIFYLKLKDKEFDFTIINNKNFYYTIFRGYDSIIQNLKEYSPMFKTSSKKTLNNSKNIKEFVYLVMDANDNKFNYYNYGSEASLLFLLKPDMTLEEIRNYIIILKDEKNKNSKLKDFIYTFDDYCYKIGYDLALSLYIFTDISLKIKLEILSNIIKDIVKDGYRTINDDYMNKIEIYFDNMINEPKFKTDIERIFNNDLYRDNNEQKQLKYNLYMHKYKEFKENNKTILLWFINNVILRF